MVFAKARRVCPLCDEVLPRLGSSKHECPSANFAIVASGATLPVAVPTPGLLSSCGTMSGASWASSTVSFANDLDVKDFSEDLAAGMSRAELEKRFPVGLRVETQCDMAGEDKKEYRAGTTGRIWSVYNTGCVLVCVDGPASGVDQAVSHGADPDEDAAAPKGRLARARDVDRKGKPAAAPLAAIICEPQDVVRVGWLSKGVRVATTQVELALGGGRSVNLARGTPAVITRTSSKRAAYMVELDDGQAVCIPAHMVEPVVAKDSGRKHGLFARIKARIAAKIS